MPYVLCRTYCLWLSCNKMILLINSYIITPHQGRKAEPFQATTMMGLEKPIAVVSRNDSLVALGDFNSRLERSWKDNGFQDACFIGRWSIHHRGCPGGTLLRDLLHTHDLCAVSTTFQPRKSNRKTRSTKSTWLNFDNRAKPSQIDYMLISNRWKSGVTSCRVKWGPSIRRWGERKDHGAVVARMTTRMRTAHKNNRWFATDRLRDKGTRLTFAEAVRLGIDDRSMVEAGRSWSKLVEAPTPLTVDGRWKRLKDALLSTVKETLKLARNPHKRKIYTYVDFVGIRG